MATIRCEASGCGNTDKSGKIFPSAADVDVGGAATMATKEKNVPDVAKDFYSPEETNKNHALN